MTESKKPSVAAQLDNIRQVVEEIEHRLYLIEERVKAGDNRMMRTREVKERINKGVTWVTDHGKTEFVTGARKER